MNKIYFEKTKIFPFKQLITECKKDPTIKVGSGVCILCINNYEWSVDEQWVECSFKKDN